MDQNEIQVKTHLESYGLTCKEFTKEEKRKGKTPDFRVYKNDDLLFYCEVKTREKDCWLDEKLDNAEQGEIIGGICNDPIFNSLSTNIHTAVKQFDAVNPEQDVPNVLALVNHDKNYGFNDLLETVTGNFYSENGGVDPISKQYSEGRIKDEKGRIDLFIWLDDHKPDRRLCSQINQERHLKLCEAFNVNPESIEQIDS